MTTAGWVLMLSSWALILSLFAYSLGRILSRKPKA
jgi:hypothetical protein